MSNGRALQHRTTALTELLGNCARFNGVWPADLALYPQLWRRRLRQGRGIGLNPHYRPWLRVRDLGSRGTSHVIFGIKSRRRHHLLSDYELLYFLLAERRRSTQQVLEQWPILDLYGTLGLASELHLSHPRNSRGVVDPVTVDFLLHQEIDGESIALAVAVKAPEDAGDPNVLRQLEMQERWCSARGLDWALADMSVIPDTRTSLESLKFIRWWFRRGAVEPDPKVTHRVAKTLLDRYESSLTLRDLIERTAASAGLPRSVASHVVRYAAWCGDIPVDVRAPIQLNLPLVLLHGH